MPFLLRSKPRSDTTQVLAETGRQSCSVARPPPPPYSQRRSFQDVRIRRRPAHPHPDVQEAAVAGIPDSYRGEALVAYAVGRETVLNREALQAHLEARLTRYKVPAHLIQVDALPKTAVGKPDKPALRKMALALAR